MVASIILVAPPCYRWLRPFLQRDPFLPRVLYTKHQEWARQAREKVGSLAVVSLAAWLGSLPLMWGHFGLVTPVAVLASLVLVPVVFVILAVALGGLLAGLVWQPAEQFLNRSNAVVVSGAYAGARGFAALPGKPMRQVLQAVGERLDVHFDRLWGRDERRATQLVFIGKGIEAATLSAALEKALA